MQLRFGEFTLDTDARQLRRDSADRHLSPQGIDLLRLLIEHRPRALSKREIHKRLWPDASFSEATLSSLVAEVRRALDETAMREGFIRTAHRYGYAFKGEATEVEPVEPARDDRIRCWIVWSTGQIGLRDGEHVLGREADVSVWLDRPTVSRYHAKIRVSSSGATIEDLGSRNGTYLQGLRLTGSAPLADGDEIVLGSFPVRFRDADPRVSVRPAPEAPQSIRRR
jgi:DNA-binding winged helix-turn-helix (wHTH) protein